MAGQPLRVRTLLSHGDHTIALYFLDGTVVLSETERQFAFTKPGQPDMLQALLLGETGQLLLHALSQMPAVTHCTLRRRECCISISKERSLQYQYQILRKTLRQLSAGRYDLTFRRQYSIPPLPPILRQEYRIISGTLQPVLVGR